MLNDIRESLNGACARPSVPRIHVHGLRHTFGSQMAMAGADPFAIVKAMGHADIKTTMIYVSSGKSHVREQMERLNGVYTAVADRYAIESAWGKNRMVIQGPKTPIP